MSHPQHIKLDEALLADMVRAAGRRVFDQRLATSAFTAPLGIVVLAWMQAPVAGGTRALAWMAAMLAIELAIVGLSLCYRRATTRDGREVLWYRLEIAVTGTVGLAWGASIWVFAVPGELLHYIINLTVLVAVSAISIVVMAPSRMATLLFTGGVLLPPQLHLALIPNPLAAECAAGLAVLFVAELIYARVAGRQMLDELDSSARNRLMAEELVAVRAALHSTNHELETRNTDLQATLARLNDLVTHDELTGVFNRRFIVDELERQVARKARHDHRSSLVMIDLDHFKRINDTHGHATGDRALRLAATAIGGELREGDLLARIGGEEFLVVLPLCAVDAAAQFAERLRQALAAHPLIEPGITLALRASFGVAELRAGEDVTAWLRRTDAALYAAKAAGRDRVVTDPL